MHGGPLWPTAYRLMAPFVVKEYPAISQLYINICCKWINAIETMKNAELSIVEEKQTVKQT